MANDTKSDTTTESSWTRIETEDEWEVVSDDTDATALDAIEEEYEYEEFEYEEFRPAYDEAAAWRKAVEDSRRLILEERRFAGPPLVPENDELVALRIASLDVDGHCNQIDADLEIATRLQEEEYSRLDDAHPSSAVTVAY